MTDLINRIFSGLAMTAAVVTPLASFALIPAEGKSGVEARFDGELQKRS